MRGTLAAALLLAMLGARPAAAEPPRITFQRLTDRAALEWAAEWKADTVSLDLEGVRALGPREVLVFGELRAPPVAVRSVLLHSRDGGRTWSETLPSLHGSGVVDVQLLGRDGFALVGWSTEGPGEITLFATKDGGAIWARRGPIPKETWDGWPVEMAWRDATHGRIVLAYEADEERRSTIVTEDGGKTWKVDPAKKPAATKELPSARESRASDGTRWRIVDGAEKGTRVERRLAGDAGWHLQATLPAKVRLRGGRTLTP